MKKLILILLSITIIGCSSDDSSSDDNQDGFALLYKDSCESETTNTLCTTKFKYDEALNNPIYVNETCFKIKIDNNWYIWKGGRNFCN